MVEINHDAMKNKEKHIMTEEQIKTQQSSVILAAVKCTKTIPITLLRKLSTDLSDQETKTTEGTAIKTNVHQWQVYLSNLSPPLSITTEDLLEQNECSVNPPRNVVSCATRMKNLRRMKREKVKKEVQLISERKKMAETSREEWIHHEYTMTQQPTYKKIIP